MVTAGHVLLGTAAVGAVDRLLTSRPGPMSGGAVTLVQASGLVALVWAYVGLILGLAVGARGPRSRNAGQSARRPNLAGLSVSAFPRERRRRPDRRAALLTLHRQIDLMALALTLLHALVFALAEPGGTLLIALLPGTAPVQTLGFNLGVIGLYLMAVLGPTYYLRERIGRRVWLVAHQLVAVSYAVALWHAMALGSTLRLTGVARTLTWIVQVPLLVMIALRLLHPRRAADQLRVSVRGARYSGWRHSLLRTTMAWGLLVTAVIVLLMALLAAGPESVGPR